MPDGNPAPPRPRSPEALISEMSYRGLSVMHSGLCILTCDKPNRDPSILSPSFYANLHTSSRFLDPRHDGRRGFEISDPGLSILQSAFSSAAVHPVLWLDLAVAGVVTQM